MKSTLATLLTMGVSLALLFPATASADPWITVSTKTGAGAIGNRGQIIKIAGSGCTLAGKQAVMGEFFTSEPDPLTATDPWQFEFPVNASGAFNWDVNVPADHPAQTFQARWYCASSPVSSIDSPEIQWLSPLLAFEIGDDSPTTQNNLVDPNALPAVDKMSIVGAKAAALKKRTDERAARNGSSSNEEFVRSAFLELTGRGASSKTRQPFVDRLNNGELRVQVAEDIALTERDAGSWNVAP